jgi:putative molybdopterin biosynthesis protein
VRSGRADTGLGVLAAARALDLDFVPLAEEPYDLVLRAETLDGRAVRALLDLLDEPGFREAIEALGGYDTRETGLRLR